MGGRCRLFGNERGLVLATASAWRWKGAQGAPPIRWSGIPPCSSAPWASSGLTDIQHQGHRPGKDVQNGDHGTEEAPSPSVVHPGVQG